MTHPTPNSSRAIKVLVVDDSTVVQLLLTHILETDPAIRVVGAVGDGHRAVDFVTDRPPDVILMDIHMPGMDGFEATRRIMETRPVPIVICSAATNPSDVATTFRAMEAGAVACVEKPVGRQHPGFDRMADALRQTVRLMSEVKVVRRRSRESHGRAAAAASAASNRSHGNIQVVGIGASTGGPQVLQQILADLPKSFPVPILVVQHIARGFVAGLVEWLGQTTGLHTQVAAYGALPKAGHVYFAPDDFHMGVNGQGRIVLTREEPLAHLRPAVAYLFRSLADAYGAAAIGVLLTGMGRDGAAELKLMKEHGALTIAQDRETSVVHGMPGEAIRLGGATHVLRPERIAETLVAAVTGGHASEAVS